MAPPVNPAAAAPARRSLVSPTERLVAGGIAAACLAPLVVASFLHAGTNGHGTHEQLGLPACGWLQATGYPCATCGMTTAFSHATHGDLAAAFFAQPMGLALALGAATGFWIALHAAVTGSRALRVVAGLGTGRVAVAAALLWGAGWAYKVATWPG